MATTFLELINAIKEEARIDTTTVLDPMIKRIINEVMIKRTRNKEFSALYVPNSALTITSDQQSSFTLPTDIGKIKDIQFSIDGDSYFPVKERNQYAAYSPTLGYPSWWYIAGGQLIVYPYTNILTTNFINVSYFKVPPALVADGDLLLVDDLYPVIINETLSRVMRYHKQATEDAAYARDAREAVAIARQ